MPRGKLSISELSDAEEAAIQAEIAADAENPELTDEELAGLRPAGAVLPSQLYDALTKRSRGRPKSDSKKVEIKLRVDPDVLKGFKADGPGWQTRMHAALRAGLRTSATGAGRSGARTAERPTGGAGRRRPKERA